MLSFKIDTRQNIVVDFSVITVPKFLEVINYGRDNNKMDVANKILLYTYFLCDTGDGNPYRDMDPAHKISIITNAVFGPITKLTTRENALLQESIDAYYLHNDDALSRLTSAIDGKIESLKLDIDSFVFRHSENVNPNTGVVTYTSNEKRLTNLTQLIKELVDAKLMIVEKSARIKKSSKLTGKKAALSLIENGRLSDINENV